MPFVESGAEPAAIANPLSEKYAGAPPVTVAGPDRLVRAQPAPRRARTSACSRPAAASCPRPAKDGRRRSPGAARRTVRTGRSPTRAVDFFDVKGVVEARLRHVRASPPTSASPQRPFLVRGRAAEAHSLRDGAHDAARDRRPVAAGDRRGARLSRRRRALRRRDRSRRRSSRSPPATTCAPSRCRAIRRSSATSRFSSPTGCLRARFVALSVRQHRRRWFRSSSSIATQERAFQPSRSACRCASPSGLPIAR